MSAGFSPGTYLHDGVGINSKMLAVRLPTKVISCLGLPSNQCRTIVEFVHHALGPEFCSKPSKLMSISTEDMLIVLIVALIAF